MHDKHLVLGGLGFIGSHLCDALLARGDVVIAFDDMSTGRRENIAHLRDHKRFHVVQGDVRVPRDLGWNGAYFLHGSFSRIWNLACPASPPVYQRDPVGTMMTCVVGTKNALDLAKLCGAVMVQASTSEVYGDPLVHPQCEVYHGNVNPHGPRSCYDEGKRAAEALCHDYANTHGVDVRIARIFNTYGERMRPDDGRVVSNFIVQALRGERLTVYGDGGQTRSLCHVSDLVRGLVALGVVSAEQHEPINLGNPHEVTITSLAAIILSLTGRAAIEDLIKDPGLLDTMLERLPALVDDPCQRLPDITRAESLLQWRPEVKLHDGLQRMIDHFRSELKL